MLTSTILILVASATSSWAQLASGLTIQTIDISTSSVGTPTQSACNIVCVKEPCFACSTVAPSVITTPIGFPISESGVLSVPAGETGSPTPAPSSTNSGASTDGSTIASTAASTASSTAPTATQSTGASPPSHSARQATPILLAMALGFASTLF